MSRLSIALLVAATLFATPPGASAAPPETRAELRVRAWSLDNYARDGARTEFWDQRLRLAVNWPVTETVMIQVRADILEDVWGEPPSSDGPSVTVIPATGPPPPPTGNPWASPEVREIAVDLANMQFVWPGTPLKFVIGRQDVSWGTGYWTQADERDRFLVAAKLDPVVVVLAYDKLTEVFDRHDTLDDWRAWAIGAVGDAAGFRLGFLAAYMRDESRVMFPAGDVDYLAGDLFATGRIGPVGLQAECVYGSGTLARDDGSELDLGGLGAYAGAFLPTGRNLTLGLEGAYARGDDPATPGKQEGFFAADYQGPYWSVIFYNNLDYPGYAADAQASNPRRDTSVRNARSGKLSAVFTPLKDLRVTCAGLYAQADRVPAGVARELGWEFDLVADYALAPNVSLTAGVGYAFLGDYWRTAPVAGDSGGRPGNPLAAVLAWTTRF